MNSDHPREDQERSLSAGDGTPIAERKRIVVAVCTYKRNEPLRRLLRAVTRCAEHVRDRAAVGVVIVDDTADGQAQCVAEEFDEAFELGLAYRISGKQNISIARNLALETALHIGDWIAMTDDDCEPSPQWIEAFVDLLDRTDALAISGWMERRIPTGSPQWLRAQPFLELGLVRQPHNAEIDTASTHNSMISGAWLRQHPHIRFDPAFGVIGGEDMVFYRAARAAGLRIRFSQEAIVYENEPASRTTLRYQLYSYLWHGNSSYLTCKRNGQEDWRLFVHGCASSARAFVRPLRRIAARKPPQWRYSLALLCNGIGKLLGPLGIRIEHR